MAGDDIGPADALQRRDTANMIIVRVRNADETDISRIEAEFANVAFDDLGGLR